MNLRKDPNSCLSHSALLGGPNRNVVEKLPEVTKGDGDISPTSSHLTEEKSCRLSTHLPNVETSCLHREGVIVASLQVGNLEDVLRSVPQVRCGVGPTVKHVHLISLKAERTHSFKVNGSI